VHDGGHERQWCSAWGASAASGMVPAGTGCGLGGPGRDQVSQSDRFRARQDKVARAVDPDQIRTLTRVARLYYERGMRQSQIAQMLGMSQTRVSRLLSRAAEVGIVRMSVVTPPGVHAELEENLEARFGMREVVAVDCGDDSGGDSTGDDYLLAALGTAGAAYLESNLTGHDRIGISSWSATLLAVVDSMRPRPTRAAEEVVQLQGGVGNVSLQSYATRLTEGLAHLTGAQPLFLAAPGLVADRKIRDALVADPNIASVMKAYGRLTMLVAGIGSLEPSPLLQRSGNAIGEAEQKQLRRLRAVGDICLHFFDAAGNAITSDLDQRVIGISAKALRLVPRRIGIAGGTRKFAAIRAALRGGWIDVLITDLTTAERLAEEP
jgi:DNA-binding transcriptional regulator LsrR (DeoR family)